MSAGICLDIILSNIVYELDFVAFCAFSTSVEKCFAKVRNLALLNCLDPSILNLYYYFLIYL